MGRLPGVDTDIAYVGVQPWQVLPLDLGGSFTLTKAANTTILVLSNHFPRWQDTISLPNGTEEVVAEVLETGSFATWMFQKESMQTKKLKLSISRRAAYHP